MINSPTPPSTATRPTSLGWAALALALVAAMVLLPFNSAHAAEEPPTIDGCQLTIPESSADDIDYTVEGEVFPAGTYDMREHASDWYGQFTIETFGVDAVNIDTWQFEFPLECTVDIDIECESFTVTDRLNWGTLGLEYIDPYGPDDPIGPTSTAGDVSFFDDVPATNTGLLTIHEAELQRAVDIPLIIPACSSDGVPAGAPKAGR